MNFPFFAVCLFVGFSTAMGDDVLSKITKALPPGWYIAETKASDVPDWSFSKASADKIVLVGTAKTGYSYFRADKSLISKQDFKRESLEVWIAPLGFELGLTFANRLGNTFSIAPRKLPELIQTDTHRIYIRESVYSLPSPYIKTSPEGTRLALPIEFERSWPSWFKDIKKQIEQTDAANRHPSGTSGMSPADSASRAGDMPEASGDSSSGTLGKQNDPPLDERGAPKSVPCNSKPDNSTDSNRRLVSPMAL